MYGPQGEKYRRQEYWGIGVLGCWGAGELGYWGIGIGVLGEWSAGVAGGNASGGKKDLLLESGGNAMWTG
jgi:hypothetical protein